MDKQWTATEIEHLDALDADSAASSDIGTVRALRTAQRSIGHAWDRADDADCDDARKDKIAGALRAVEAALRAYGAAGTK